MPDQIIDGLGSAYPWQINNYNAAKVYMNVNGSDVGSTTPMPIYQPEVTTSNIHTGSKEIQVFMQNHICAENTSSSPIGAGSSFIGSWQNVIDYSEIRVSVISDVNSATDGLAIQWSADGVNLITGVDDNFTIPSNTGKTFSTPRNWPYFRVNYTNGSVDQGSFFIMSQVDRMASKGSMHRIQDRISSDDDATLTKSVLSGEDQDGTFQNVQTTRDGNLTISDNSNGLSIAEGNVTGKTFIHKFGNAPDFDTADGDVTVWDGAEDGTTWENMVYDYSTTADIDRISSSSTSDTINITVYGLDSNWNEVTQTITLTGQTPAPLSTNLIRVFRMVNTNGTDLVGHVFCFVNVATTGGVPNTPANIRAIIQPGNNQTLMAVYSVPAGKTGYMRDWYASTAGANKSSNYPVKVFARPFGSVFQLKHISAVSDNGSSHVQHNYIEPEVFAEKTDIEMRMSMTAVGGTAASVSAGFDIVLVNN